MRQILCFLLLASVAQAQVNPIDLEGCKREISPFDGKKDDFVGKESDTKTNAKKQKVWITLTPRCFYKRIPDPKRPGRTKRVCAEKWAKPFKFRSVAIWKDGKRISKLKFVYHWPEDKKPQRGVYRTELAPKSIPKFSVLKYDGNCSVLPNPGKRID